MSVKFAENYLRKICEQLHEMFYGKPLAVLEQFSKLTNAKHIFDTDKKITELTIVGVNGTFRTITLHILIIYGNNESMLLKFSTNYNFYKRKINVYEMQILGLRDMPYCDENINCDCDLNISDILVIKYLGNHPENITNIYGTSIKEEENIFYKYDKLLIHEFVIGPDRYGFMNYKFTGVNYMFWQMTNHIDVSFDIGYNFNSGTKSSYNKKSFIRADEESIEMDASSSSHEGIESSEYMHPARRLNIKLADFFMKVMHVFDDIKITSLLIGILEEIYRKNMTLFAERICIKDMRKELYGNMLRVELHFIEKTIAILRKKLIKMSDRNTREEILSVLLLRAVVFEQTLLHFRRLIQS